MTSDDALTRDRYLNIGDESTEELKTIKDRVAYIMNRSPRSRNSDKLLLIEMLKTFYGIDPAEKTLNDFLELKVPTEKTVARWRAHFQNRMQIYLPTAPDVVVKRLGKRRAFEHVFSSSEVVDELSVGSNRVMRIHSDESGKTHAFSVLGTYFSVQYSDLFIATKEILELETLGKLRSGKALSFKDLTRTTLDSPMVLVKLLLSKPTAKACLFIYVNSNVPGQGDRRLSLMYELGILSIIDSLMRSGQISKGHEIELSPDKGVAPIEIKYAESNLVPKLRERGLTIAPTLIPVDDKDSRFVQVADLLAGSIGRILNDPGNNHKDEFAKGILSYIGFTESDVKQIASEPGQEISRQNVTIARMV